MMVCAVDLITLICIVDEMKGMQFSGDWNVKVLCRAENEDEPVVACDVGSKVRW